MRILRMILLACILVFLCIACSTAAEDNPVGSEEELLEVLSDCRAKGLTECTMELTREYFDDFSADSFAMLGIVKLKAGILDADLRYSSSSRTILFSNMAWGDPVWTECADMDEAMKAISGFVNDGIREFSLACTPELFQKLVNGRAIYSLFARSGAEDVDFRYTMSGGIIMVDKYTCMSLPWAVAENEQEFLNAIDRFARDNTESFYIACLPEFYKRIADDKEASRKLLATSELDSYRLRYSSAYSYYLFSEATYSFMPRIICQTEEDVSGTIRRMGSAGIDTFNLILTEELFSSLREDYFAPLHKLETEGGMVSSRMSYDFFNYILYYSEAEIAAEVIQLNTLAEVSDYLSRQVMDGEKEIVLFLSPEIYGKLMAGISSFAIINDSMAPFYDLTAHAGLFDYTFSYSSGTHVVQLHVKEFYPGTEIACAVQSGRADRLSGRLGETYGAARRIAQECTAETQLQTARNIHDYLCRTVEYTIDEQTDEDDTAVGAILNRQANCDGYADAFYLIATLSGINTRYQHGDSYNIGLSVDLMNSVTHLWNLIEIDGSWRMVDVTWDDSDEEISYTWFNLGMDRAGRMHIWNEEMSVPLRPDTDLSCRPDNEYLTGSYDEGISAIQEALGRKQNTFQLIFTDEASAGEQDRLRHVLQEMAPSGFRYSWNERMFTLTFLNIDY